eukprot:scpid83486/ scgid11608/ 
MQIQVAILGMIGLASVNQVHATQCQPGYYYIKVTGWCSDINECNQNDLLCTSDTVYPSTCQNTEGSYICHLPHVTKLEFPTGYSVRGVTITRIGYHGNIAPHLVFGCEQGFFEHCATTGNCIRGYNGDWASYKLARTVEESTGLWYTSTTYYYTYYNLPECRPIATKVCAGVQVYYAHLPVTYLEAHHACQSRKMRLPSEGFTHVQFSATASKCFGDAPNSTWNSESMVADLSADPQTSALPSRSVKPGHKNSFLCVPIDFQTAVHREDIKLAKNIKPFPCSGGANLYLVDTPEQGRTFREAQLACRKRALELPGPRLFRCMRILGYKSKPGAEAWMAAASTVHSDWSYTTGGFPQDIRQRHHLTICTSY